MSWRCWCRDREGQVEGTGRGDRAAICVFFEDACAVSVRDFSPGEEATVESRQDYLCNVPPVHHVGKCVPQLDVLCCQIAQHVPLRQTTHLLLLRIVQISAGLKTISPRNTPTDLPTRARVLSISRDTVHQCGHAPRSLPLNLLQLLDQSAAVLFCSRACCHSRVHKASMEKKIPEGLKGRFGFENNAKLPGSEARGAVPLIHRRGAVESAARTIKVPH